VLHIQLDVDRVKDLRKQSEVERKARGKGLRQSRGFLVYAGADEAYHKDNNDGNKAHD
jgi:hypothetical protein